MLQLLSQYLLQTSPICRTLRGRVAEMTTTLVYGLAISGQAVARELAARGDSLILADDSIDGSAIESHRSLATEIGAEFFQAQMKNNCEKSSTKLIGLPQHPAFRKFTKLSTFRISKIKFCFQKSKSLMRSNNQHRHLAQWLQ